MNQLAYNSKGIAHKAPAAAIGAGMPLDQFSQDESAFQQSVTEFCERTLKDRVMACDDQAAIDPHVIAALFTTGLMGLQIPQVYGGQGHSVFKTVLAIEAISRVDPSMAVFIHVHNLLTNSIILKYGSEEQKKTFLPRLAVKDIGAFAATEEHAGSDLSHLATTAELKGDHYVLNGKKRWITNAREAGLFIVIARAVGASSQRAVSAFIVDARSPGIHVSDQIHKMGLKASSTCEVTFDNVVVPGGCLLGPAGGGFDVASFGITLGRIGIAAQMTGLAQGVLEHAVTYACEREQFGMPICKFQGVSFPIAKAATEWHAARLMTYNVARKAEAGTPYFRLTEEASGAKLFTSQVAESAASVALETLGGNGFARDFRVEKFYRDSKAGKIYEGTSNILMRTIASVLMPRSAT
jgi:alkylation response protein AidB-like acyl-CoA dehydrogenase